MSRLAWSLLWLGILGVVGAVSKLHASVIADPPYDFTGSSRFGWSLAYILLLAVTAYGLGLPDLPGDRRQAVTTAVSASAAAAVAISLVQLVVGDALLPRMVVFGSALLLIPWYVFCAWVARSGREQAASADRVFLVGCPEAADDLRRELDLRPERPATLLASLPDELAAGAPGESPLADEVQRSDISVVVLDRGAQADDRVVAQVAALHEQGVRVRTLSLFYEEWLGKLPMSELERVSLMFDIGEVHRARYGRIKRLIDIVLGLVGLVPLLLLLPVVWVANLAWNRGPLFYRQPRVGKDGEVFSIWKFRTMRPSDGVGDAWTEEDDPRITPFGRLLRVSHLDELPQVLNILGGTLAVVGPRPEQPRYVEELRAKLPFYDLRHLVSPGLTGWAQVKYGYAGDESDAREKLQYDFYYLRRQSLRLDARIVGRTVRAVVGRGGR